MPNKLTIIHFITKGTATRSLIHRTQSKSDNIQQDLLAERLPALITVPGPNRLPSQSHTLPVEPFVGTVFIVTGDHVTMADSAACTIDLGVLGTLLLLLFIIQVFVRINALVRIRRVGATEHGIIIFVALAGRRLLRELDAASSAGGALGVLAGCRELGLLDLLVRGDFLRQCLLDAGGCARAGTTSTAAGRGASLGGARAQRGLAQVGGRCRERTQGCAQPTAFGIHRAGGRLALSLLKMDSCRGSRGGRCRAASATLRGHRGWTCRSRRSLVQALRCGEDGVHVAGSRVARGSVSRRVGWGRVGEERLGRITVLILVVKERREGGVIGEQALVLEISDTCIQPLDCPIQERTGLLSQRDLLILDSEGPVEILLDLLGVLLLLGVYQQTAVCLDEFLDAAISRVDFGAAFLNDLVFRLNLFHQVGHLGWQVGGIVYELFQDCRAVLRAVRHGRLRGGG